MYEQHFGLTELPFTLTPDTGYFVGLAPHVEAIQVLQTALQMGEGFIKVTGEVGSGKTLLCRKLLNDLPERFQCAYIPNPYLTPQELNWALAAELNIKTRQNVNQVQLSNLIQQKLIRSARGGKTVVLVLDEAQAIPSETLEALRLYTNLETEKRKLLHVVMFGQPELDQRLATTQFRQLRQRIGFNYSLRPLTDAEAHNYIEQRLRAAGLTGASLISPAVAGMISAAARGTPRLINILSHKALLLCFGEGQRQISKQHVQTAISDTEDAGHGSGLKGKYIITAAAAVLLLAVIAAYA